ncbi:hypothetical protein [Mycobacterium uberis]|uniref:hypothetical protein n=1 Tax=Mycobacterium uberis TaxID=2162698 RepID=UPI001401D6FB|nr:hypothetical protein [Mycobacterium uberis]
MQSEFAQYGLTEARLNCIASAAGVSQEWLYAHLEKTKRRFFAAWSPPTWWNFSPRSH